MTLNLGAEERRLLRREVDRRLRERLGEITPTDGWVTLTEASEIVGIRAQRLRRKVTALGIETKRSAGRRLIRVQDQIKSRLLRGNRDLRF